MCTGQSDALKAPQLTTEGIEIQRQNAESFLRVDNNDLDDIHCYGGNFSVVGHCYNLTVPMGVKPLQWLNKLTSQWLHLDAIVFDRDGGFRRPGDMTPMFPKGGMDLCWRWEPHRGRFIIDFYRNGKLLQWRWDELWPTEYPDGLSLPGGGGPELIGIGHFGKRKFQYSMRSMGPSRQLVTTARHHRWGIPVFNASSPHHSPASKQYSQFMYSPTNSGTSLPSPAASTFLLGMPGLEEVDELEEVSEEKLTFGTIGKAELDGTCLCVGSCCCWKGDEMPNLTRSLGDVVEDAKSPRRRCGSSSTRGPSASSYLTGSLSSSGSIDSGLDALGSSSDASDSEPEFCLSSLMKHDKAFTKDAIYMNALYRKTKEAASPSESPPTHGDTADLGSVKENQEGFGILTKATEDDIPGNRRSKLGEIQIFDDLPTWGIKTQQAASVANELPIQGGVEDMGRQISTETEISRLFSCSSLALSEDLSSSHTSSAVLERPSWIQRPRLPRPVWDWDSFSHPPQEKYNLGWFSRPRSDDQQSSGIANTTSQATGELLQQLEEIRFQNRQQLMQALPAGHAAARRKSRGKLQGSREQSRGYGKRPVMLWLKSSIRFLLY